MMKTRKFLVFILLVIGSLILIFWPGKVQPTEAQLQPTSVPTQNDPSSRVLRPSSTLFSYQGQLLDANGDLIDDHVEMAFGLYDQAAGSTPFWTEAYTGTQAITVTNGLFHVLLGSITPIDATDLTGDIYLELTVNGETLVPRELLTSVAYAVKAVAVSVPNPNNDQANVSLNWLNDTARIRIGGNGIGASNGLDIQGVGNASLFRVYGDGDARITGDVTINGSGQSIFNNPQDVTAQGAAALRFGSGSNWLGIDNNEIVSYGDELHLQDSDADMPVKVHTDLVADGNVSVGGSITSIRDINGVGNLRGDDGQQLHMPAGGNIYVNWHSGNGVVFGGGDQSADVSIGSSGINMYGNSIANCGAFVEANLQTAEELKAGSIDRFEEGDVLCWGIDQLELCSITNDRLVQAVADDQGRPIVLGAEVIKVLGPVKRGDILVASNVPGYAMVNNDPISGSVIAQALEDFNGESGLIKAMIRKW